MHDTPLVREGVHEAVPKKQSSMSAVVFRSLAEPREVVELPRLADPSTLKHVLCVYMRVLGA
jgi:hypothetical protein